MNTVGPYHNRQETYAYFSLPFCPGKVSIHLLVETSYFTSTGPKETIGHYHETLGEALQGTELEFSGLDIDYKSKISQYYLVCFWELFNVLDLYRRCCKDKVLQCQAIRGEISGFCLCSEESLLVSNVPG